MVKVLEGDLDFHNKKSNYGSHNFHSFPAKFPPQLPRKFILELSKAHEIILDPMAGSGTTILESILNKRIGIGYDIDPLALMISEVKTSSYNKKHLYDIFNNILNEATLLLGKSSLLSNYFSAFEPEKKEFLKFWFTEESISELISLLIPISEIENRKYQTFFNVIFSSIIITKSGGVSLALDLAHTRPHRAKKAFNSNSEILFDFGKYEENPRHHILSKRFRSPISEFKKKFFTNIEIVTEQIYDKAQIEYADSQNLPLPDNYVDLIITSPPYASNAIDYMRAHKFSLLWFDYRLEELKEKRSICIGGDSISKINFEPLPEYAQSIINNIALINSKKALVLHRYYSEMTRSLREMYRVLKPMKAAIVVVGNSIFNGISSETHHCLKAIGENIGFIVPKIGVRTIDRNRRMLPTSKTGTETSQIQKRMDKEFVIGFYKK
ncbi:MAG: site-specific DNA-methyltransferase [Melioribacteraceae bacterium]|nr:site-specific DNA-methyltransferase [Melioribacteraceae bacterium]